MTNVQIKQGYFEIPVIPMKRDEFLELLRKYVCSDWQEIIIELDYLNLGNVQFLDRLWEQLSGDVKEYGVYSDALSNLVFVLEVLPLSWQWQFYKAMLWDQFKGINTYTYQDSIGHLDRVFQAQNFTGVAYQMAYEIFSMLPESDKTSWADVTEEFNRLRDFWMPFSEYNLYSSKEFGIDWTGEYVQDWLSNHILAPYAGDHCPFFFEDDPISLKTYFLRQE